MQLKNIRERISLATCTLLQVSGSVHAVNGAAVEWDVDTALLLYSESDGRVSALEPAIRASREFEEGDRVNLQLVFDSLTGATPNGAHASSVTQTLTSASGNSLITASPGETPVDDSFLDARFALSAEWEMPLDRLTKIILGANFSTEFDYDSLGASATYSKDFNARNTTLTAGLAYTNDVSKPVGGLTQAFTPMNSLGRSIQGDSATKTTADLLLGITQVISKKTLMQLNYTYSNVDGYQNDPYKVITVADPTTGLPTNSALLNISPFTLPYVYENRPDTRTKNNLFFRTAHHLVEDVLHFSYRYYWDDWDITSQTFDVKYRYELGSGSYLQPHFRFYMQDAAFFYVHNLVQGTDVGATGNVLVSFASHDYRLADFNSTTVGLKYGFPVSSTSEFSARAEVITQTTDDGGVPLGEETPDLTAFVIQANYSFAW